MAIQHLRSSTANKRPLPASMSDGQVAINTNTASPGVFFKDSAGALIKIGPTHIGATAPNASPAVGGATGNTVGEQWLDTTGGTYVLKIWDGSAWRSETGTFVDVNGDTMTGTLVMDNQQQVRFRETTANGTNYIAIQAPASVAADRTLTLPDVSGTIVSTGDTGTVTSTMIADGTIVNADVNASAAIVGTKISPDFGSQNVTSTGTSTAASFIPTSSTAPTNGLYLNAANSVALSTNGTGRLFVDASGNVGIGTTTSLNAFTLSRADNTGAIELRIDNTGSSYQSALRFTGKDAGGLYPVVALIQGYQATNADSGELRFSTKPTGGSATERLRIDSSGRLLVGTPTNRTGYSLQVEGTSDATGSSSVIRNSNDSIGGALDFGKSRGTTLNSNTIVIAGDRLGSIRFKGADGSALLTGALIEAKVDATPGANDLPTRIEFSTTADGAASPTERLRITSAGLVGIGTVSPAATLHVLTSSTTPAQIESSGAKSQILFRDSGTGANYPLIGSDNSALILRGGNSNAENARIDSSGRLLVGTSSARSNFFPSAGWFPTVQIETATNGGRGLSIVNNRTDNNGPQITFGKANGSAIGSADIVLNNDTLGAISFTGADGTNLIQGARIEAAVDGTPGVNDMPGRIVLSTTLDGASSPTERLRITNDGVRGYNQPAPVAVDTTATLTVANLKTGIITSTTAAAVTMTLPTGTLTEGGFSGLYNNFTFEWTVINTGATNAVTVQGGTDHTLVGSGTIAAGVSGRFASRRTATNTFVTYRLS